MTEAAQARAAALPVEVKKDSLSQLQNGDWKLTLKVAAQDMPAAILEALPGTRYQTAFVEVDDVENPIQRPEKTEGARAKFHMEAMCGDCNFSYWVWDNCRNSDGFDENETYKGARDWAKHMMGIESANELLEHPEKWQKLYDEYKYKDNAR